MLINFKEIPTSNSTSQTQDVFEKFCRDFLEKLGYEIISGPARGADGGLDIKVCEIRNSSNGISKFYWLVSCKHYAHTGKSITKSTELDIRDRVESNGCQGFMGLYTTIPNQSLLNSLEGLKGKIEYRLFDNEKIEKHIVGVHSNENLFLRYFPISFKAWKDLYYYTEPIVLLDNYLEKKHNSYRELLLKIFQTTGNLIKQVRQSNDLIAALRKENVEYLVTPIFDKGFELKGSFEEICKKQIPEEIKKSHNIELTNDIISFGYSVGTGLTYVIHANYLFVSESYNIELIDVFKDIKEVLN